MSCLHRWIVAVALLVLCAGQVPVQAVDSGNVWTWGSNWEGQLGNATNTDSRVPVPVSNLGAAIAIAGGDSHTLSVRSDGTVWAWGYNYYGQLGNGGNEDSNFPVQAVNLNGVVGVGGGWAHSLAVKSDGTAWAWGWNYNGELGNGTNTDSRVPIQVSNLTGVVSVAGGWTHSLALKSDGTVWAWGPNGLGELGNGNITYGSWVPTQVINLTGVRSIAAGLLFSLALKSDGTVWAWGSNSSGELGNGSTADRSPVPVQVSSLDGVVAIAAGDGFGLAVKEDGTVWAWGWNYSGVLGNGTNVESRVPVQVSSLTGVIAVAGGNSHSLALKSDGTVWAWGNNGSGQLGDGSWQENSYVPVQVTCLSGVTSIAAGSVHSLALHKTSLAPPPQPTSITPNTEYNTGVANITNMAGSNFQSGATVKLTRNGETDIPATSVTVVGSALITCALDLKGATPGLWNVVITNPDGQSGILANGFTVLSPPPTGDMYVDQNCPGSIHDGRSWATAYLDLAPVLAAAVSGDTIHVARGTFKPTTELDITATFKLNNGVKLLGGYPTGGGARDPATNATILSGDIGAVGDNSDNSWHVVTGSRADNTAVLDGFIVTAGCANGSWVYGGNAGAGLYNDRGSPTLTNITFSGNSAGAAMFNDNGSPTLTNVIFTENSGGGVFNADNGSPTLTNVSFIQNTWGAINNFGDMTLTNATFTGNTAGWGGGAINNQAGILTLTNVTFSDNASPGSAGGAICNFAEITLTNIIFTGNSADFGGGMYNSGYATLTNVTFSGNSAGWWGGGMANSDGNATLINVTMTDNVAATLVGLYPISKHSTSLQ